MSSAQSPEGGKFTPEMWVGLLTAAMMEGDEEAIQAYKELMAEEGLPADQIYQEISSYLEERRQRR